MPPVIVTGNAAQQAQRKEQLRKEKVQKSTVITVLSDDCFVTKSKMTTDEAIIIKQWILSDAKIVLEKTSNQQVMSTQVYQQKKAWEQQQSIQRTQDVKAVLSSSYFYVIVVLVIVGWFIFKENARY